MFNLKKQKMKKKIISMVFFTCGLLFNPGVAVCQQYVMTAEYLNKDIYGNLQDKTKVSGEYTRDLKEGPVRWNNVYISHSDNQSGVYKENIKQEYMEGFGYVVSSLIMDETFFNDFPNQPDNVLARNLIWDMMMIEGYAWNYTDSLELNKTFVIPDIHGAFNMADIGSYDHEKNELKWIGTSMMNSILCNIIEYRALDNKLEINLSEMKSKGSELYWGNIWISQKDRKIEYAEIYSFTIQELEIQGLPQKILVSTKRVVTVEKKK